MKVLVTGGCGFIGANLVDYLLEKGGYRIRILDNLSTGRKEYLDRLLNSTNPRNPTNPMNSMNPINPTNSVEPIIGDICNQGQVEEAVEGIDAVVHLAAHTSVVDSLQNPEENFQVNAIGTFNLLEASRSHGVERFVYASSNAVVGEQEPPIDERKVPAPLSPYGASKLAGEALCSAYYGAFGIKALALRFANAYGPFSEHKTSVVAKFIRRAKEGRPLIIYGDGHQTRDFIHAQDICRAIELALNYKPRTKNHALILQIATGIETKIIDLADMVRDLALQSGLNSPEIIFEEARRGEIRRNYADISRARELLKFEAQVSLREGLKEAWKSWNVEGST